MKIRAHLWEFQWHPQGWIQGGKVSAASKREAKKLVLAYLRSDKNPNREEIEHLVDGEVVKGIVLKEFERTKEVFGCWTQNASA